MTPEHHTRYKNAWLKYKSIFSYLENYKMDDFLELSQELRELRYELDQAIVCFSRDEFQEFKKTLHGFVELPGIPVWTENINAFSDNDWMKEGF